jgi:UDP-glucose 4-epimerase
MPLPPIGASLLTAPLRRFGVDLPPELLDLLRHGRGVDNRRLKRAGFDYRFTSAGTVADFVEALRIRRTVGETDPEYQYERDVEQFFRHSPAVVHDDA